ncbi:MAG: hypothetical protein IJV56_07365 [Neisseriaceae bacterium]|nr:hypothetical protein [Neisseriaceae bacterium]MBQ9725139.1 hypothetical protein [Neisseriaceae bacterium]
MNNFFCLKSIFRQPEKGFITMGLFCTYRCNGGLETHPTNLFLIILTKPCEQAVGWKTHPTTG